MTGLVYGYFDMFMNRSMNRAEIKPLRCQMKGAPTARIMTLVNGAAVNIDGEMQSKPRYPIEQVLDVLVTSSGLYQDGMFIDNALQSLMDVQGKQGLLQVRVPGGTRYYAANAIFDYAEIVDDGIMDDNGTKSSVVALHFQQLTEWVREIV